jgi:hypothetical protein
MNGSAVAQTRESWRSRGAMVGIGVAEAGARSTGVGPAYMAIDH